MITEMKDICFSCRHRVDSIKRVVDWRNRGGKGMVCDPAPKAECKRHNGYTGNDDETREYCQDYRHAEG